MSIDVAHETIQAQREHPSGAGCGEEPAMWADLAALTPPLVVCVAFLIGVAMLLRREMSPKRRAERNARRRSHDRRS